VRQSRLALAVARCRDFESKQREESTMKITQLVLVGAAGMLCAPVFSQVKPCEQLKSEIDAKLKEKGVVNYTLEIVPADQIKDQKVIGSCDGGKNKVTYARGARQAKETKEEKKK
jgi:hypothetical protein